MHKSLLLLTNRKCHHGSPGEPETRAGLFSQSFSIQQNGRRAVLSRGGAESTRGYLLGPRSAWLHTLHRLLDCFYLSFRCLELQRLCFFSNLTGLSSADGFYHLDQNSMTGITIGVCIALICIIICGFIIICRGKHRYRQRLSAAAAVLVVLLPCVRTDYRPKRVLVVLF